MRGLAATVAVAAGRSCFRRRAARVAASAAVAAAAVCEECVHGESTMLSMQLWTACLTTALRSEAHTLPTQRGHSRLGIPVTIDNTQCTQC